MANIELEYGAIATYHDQPPIETQARRWRQARQITPETTVADLIKWADNDGLSNLESLEITVRRVYA